MTWKLQYDTNAPVRPNSVPGYDGYAPASPVISNLVDQTNGFHFNTPPSASLQSSLVLYNAPNGGFMTVGDTQLGPNHSLLYQTSLSLLGPGSGFSTLDLAKFRLDQAGIQMTGPYYTASELTYYGTSSAAEGVQLNFSVQVTSLSAVSTPEPGSLTLFVLGAIGLAACRLRLVLRWMS
jgi:hypothetical protein